MRVNLVLTSICILLFASNCKKNQSLTEKPTEQTVLIDQAHAFFSAATNHLGPVAGANPRITTPKTVNWEKAKVVELSRGKAVLAPIKYEKDLFIRTTQGGQNNFHLSNLTWLLVYQVNGGYHAEMVTALPDTNYLRHPQGPFSGFVYVEDWAGNTLAKYLYDGKNILKYSSTPPSSVRSLDVAPLEVCYQLTGYNYSLAMPDGGYAWAEAPVCMPSMVPLEDPEEYSGGVDYGSVAGGGGGGGSASSSVNDFIIYPGRNIIGNIRDYLKCFTFNMESDHTYTVTVCVDQPSPETRQPWTFSGSGLTGSSSIGSNPVDVGHTFLIFKEVYGTTTIVRNVGFYPASSVMPTEGNTSSQAQLADDEDHPYNIAGTFTVNSDQFQNILGYVQLGNNKGFAYDLNSNNCTTFAINAMSMGNIYLPSTIGNWPNGQGDNPGDLGEDFRANNIPGMILSTSIVAHPNTGTCD